MSSISRPVLVAGAAAAVGETVDCTGFTHVFFWIKVTAAAGFTGTTGVQFAAVPDASVDPSTAPVLLLANLVSTVVVLPTGVTMDATNAQVNLGSVGATSLFVVRMPNPPQYVVPRFLYGAGGGTNPQTLVHAYGYGIDVY